MSQSAFEQYLKNSDYFSDVVNTHRRATADLIAILLEVLRDQNQIADPVIHEALKRLDESAGGQSIRAERRLLTNLVRDRIRK